MKEKEFVDEIEHVRMHEVKCLPYYFQNIVDGLKTFEIRYDDRGYATGDILYIREFDKLTEHYTGRQVYRKITYKTDFQQQPGYVAFAIVPVETFGEVKHALAKNKVEPPEGLIEKLLDAIVDAGLPKGYNWGEDAMESFNFGKKRAYLAMRHAFYEYFSEVKEEK